MDDSDDTKQIPVLTTEQISALTTVDLSALTFNMPSYTYSTGATGSSASIYTTAGSNGTSSSYHWGNINNISNIGSTTPGGLHVKSDAEFEGDIKWKGRSLGKLLETIEDRLAILQDPDPAKLEKHAALKKAYDHYKLLEKLIGED